MLFPPKPSPAAPPRVVVTGAGIVTALGLGWQTNAAGFRAGRRAFRPVTHFDVSRQRVKIAAEVDLPENFPATKLSAHHLDRLDHAGKMLLLAALEAWQFRRVPFLTHSVAAGRRRLFPMPAPPAAMPSATRLK